LHQAGAQNIEETSAWYKHLYIEAGGGGSIPVQPKPLLDGIKPIPGFRGALGYEWQRLKFSLSSGYSQSSGADPLVEDIYFIPMTGRVGYALPIKDRWGAEADFGFGVNLSKTHHYETALDYLAGRRSESQEVKPFFEGSIHATYTLPRNILKFYAGGGADIMFETAGPITLPVLEAGISFKPLALLPARKPKIKPPVPKPVVPVPVVEPEPEKPARFQYAIYFEADRSTKVLEQSWPLLQEAGRLLQENPEARVTLLGYAAPHGTSESQVVISAARVWFCAEYFQWECLIAEDRIQMQFFGANEKPESAAAEWQLRRRVEMVVEILPKEHTAGTPVPKPAAKPVPKDTDIGEKPDGGDPARFKYEIYFEADRGANVLAQSWPLLQEAGRLLHENPQARVTLRGYAAPSGTSEGQAAVSAARVWFCVEYFKRVCNIAENRIQMQFFGAEEKPVSAAAEWQLRRRVELIVDLNEMR